MSIRKLSDTSFQNKKVLLRCDLNVPLKNGVITDDGRIVASLSTIRKLLDANCSIVIIAHLGRPKGERKPELSLRPIAARLQELSGVEVIFSDITPDLAEKARNLKPKQIMLIENIRYEAAETSKDDSERLKLFVRQGSTFLRLATALDRRQIGAITAIRVSCQGRSRDCHLHLTPQQPHDPCSLELWSLDYKKQPFESQFNVNLVVSLETH